MLLFAEISEIHCLCCGITHVSFVNDLLSFATWLCKFLSFLGLSSLFFNGTLLVVVVYQVVMKFNIFKYCCMPKCPRWHYTIWVMSVMLPLVLHPFRLLLLVWQFLPNLSVLQVFYNIVASFFCHSYCFVIGIFMKSFHRGKSSCFLFQALTSGALKKGGLFSFDIGTVYKYKGTTIDVKVDTNSNVCLLLSHHFPLQTNVSTLK